MYIKDSLNITKVKQCNKQNTK